MAFAVILTACQAADPLDDSSWRQSFDIADCALTPTGRSDYLILEPGYQLVLEGGNEKLAITVLDDTKEVDDVLTRVVEEREWRDGELIEVSRNFFAMCIATKDVFYFGEQVDDYRDGRIISHAGAWLAGQNGARAGLIMPGDPAVGERYFQEIAPDVAMDRAEVVSVDERFQTPAGTFSDCLKTQEGSALNLKEKEFKVYAPGVGLLQDGTMLLTEYGFVEAQ